MSELKDVLATFDEGVRKDAEEEDVAGLIAETRAEITEAFDSFDADLDKLLEEARAEVAEAIASWVRNPDIASAIRRGDWKSKR